MTTSIQNNFMIWEFTVVLINNNQIDACMLLFPFSWKHPTNRFRQSAISRGHDLTPECPWLQNKDWLFSIYLTSCLWYDFCVCVLSPFMILSLHVILQTVWAKQCLWFINPLHSSSVYFFYMKYWKCICYL